MESKNVEFSYTLLAVVCGLAYLLVFAQRFIPAVIGPAMQQDLGFDLTNLAVFTSVTLYAYGLFQFPAGVLVDKIGSRSVLMASLFISGLGAIAFGTSNFVSSLVISRIIVGIGCAPILVASLTLLAIRVPSSRFPFYSSMLYIFGGIGPFLAASPLAYISSSYGWRLACISVGVFCIIYGILIYFFLGYSRKSGAVPKNIEKKEENGGFSDLFNNKSYLLFLVIGAGIPSIYLVYGGLWASKYLLDVYGYGINQFAAVLSFGAIGSVAGFLLTPIIALKFFRSIKMCLGVFGILLAIILTLFMTPFKVSFYIMSCAMFLVGFLSCGSQVIAAVGIKNMFKPSVVGKALGLYNMFPLIFGGLLQTCVGMTVSRFIVTEGAETAYAYGFLPTVGICAIGGLTAFVSLVYDSDIDR